MALTRIRGANSAASDIINPSTAALALAADDKYILFIHVIPIPYAENQKQTAVMADTNAETFYPAIAPKVKNQQKNIKSWAARPTASF